MNHRKPFHPIDLTQIPKDAVHLVGCSGIKDTEALPAHLLYKGDLFRKTKAVMEKIGCEWHILSAEHGLVHIEEMLEPYNTPMPHKAFDRGFWAGMVFRDLLDIHLQPGYTVVFWAGSHYREGLQEKLERYGLKVIVPLQGLAIGCQKHALANLTRELDRVKASPEVVA